jgi:parvulin-like peptidyl-prolyl isomerase
MLKVVMLLFFLVGTVFSSELLKEDLNKISQYDYNKSYEKLSIDEKKSVEKRLKKKLAVYDLAIKSTIPQSEEYKKSIQNAEKSILMNMYLQNKKDSIVVNTKEIKAYYKKHIRNYTNVHAFTIVRAKQEELLEYVNTLNKTPKNKLEEKFKELAKKYSEHPRKSRGGDMGFVGYDSIIQPFGKEAFKLDENSFTQKPLKTNLGYHLIYVKKIRIVSLEKLSKNIEETLRMEKYKKWFTEL